MTIDEAMRLASLREQLFRCIEDELKKDGMHKSYEGAIDVTLSFPPIFERSNQPEWTITWHCYIVPESGRHHSWSGRTLAEAIAVAEAAARKIAFPYEMERFERDVGGCCDDPTEADGSATIYGSSKKEGRLGDGPHQQSALGSMGVRSATETPSTSTQEDGQS